ncbi:trigger factor [Clostridium aminobutyricum]|uniref:peptidylprolyl isomerase n=1 Tax=Clostridium aminobutyricum TaxID=33953 RepID=A0A939D791_CLOAM|nr:trigger factor [Clostridium aminobutyricum]MBN7772809.1 trigger factor [Clostridium aminobutyricum]
MIKTNKKIVSFIMILCLTLSLAACGSKSEDKEPYDYDLSEYVTLGDYTGIKVTEEAISVSGDDVKAEIQNRLQQASTTTEDKEGTAAAGQTVNIAYVGKIDGKEFEGGSTTGTNITLGSSGYIDGFDDGVIGMKVGETKTLNLQFPEDYWGKEVAGKPVDFTVTLNSITVSNVPEYNIDFVKANSKSTTLEEYEKSVKEDLLAQKEANAKQQMQNSVWNTVVDNAKVLKYPDKELKDIKETIKTQYEPYAEQYGMEYADFMEQMLGMTEDEYAKTIVHQEMVIYSIARKEGITINDSEYDKLLKDYMKEQNITSDKEFKAQYGASFEEYVGKANLMKSFMMEKVLDFVVDQSVKVPAEESAKA